MKQEEARTYIFAAAIMLFWLLTPLYIQIKYNYSAIKISFAITVFYYIGFRFWKRKKSRQDQS
ncbi:MAG: hypothetical protein BRC27_00800 [Nanohaloarchaea archaeon SW_10_44_10]|nr:MAG: hypothetical protein BRC27_00800 [Nanohaloarchaea archaeon SW_10_44_10]